MDTSTQRQHCEVCRRAHDEKFCIALNTTTTTTTQAQQVELHVNRSQQKNRRAFNWRSINASRNFDEQTTKNNFNVYLNSSFSSVFARQLLGLIVRVRRCVSLSYTSKKKQYRTTQYNLINNIKQQQNSEEQIRQKNIWTRRLGVGRENNGERDLIGDARQIAIMVHVTHVRVDCRTRMQTEKKGI